LKVFFNPTPHRNRELIADRVRASMLARLREIEIRVCLQRILNDQIALRRLVLDVQPSVLLPYFIR
jgi:hypothetical protein